MAHILLTWEFGAGLGHLTRLIPVARELRGYGHRVTLAVPQPEAAQPLVSKKFGKDDGVRLIKGHSWPPPVGPESLKTPTHTLADVLMLFGYNNSERLYGEVKKWKKLIRNERPDLIVSDFSPTIRLALAGSLPIVVIGNGYTVPPVGRLLPPIRPWETYIHPLSRAHEAIIWRSVNRVLKYMRHPLIEYFSDLFSGDNTFICTIPEFDPYQRYRNCALHSPFNIAPPCGIHQTTPKNTAFVYLPNAHPLMKEVVNSLCALGIKSDVYIPRIDNKMAEKLKHENIRLHRSPLALNKVLPEKRLIIHHGGLGTAFEAGLSSTPQILIPKRLEHGVTSHALAALGCGRELSQGMDEEQVRASISEFITDDDIYKSAKYVSKKFMGYWRDGGQSEIASEIDKMC